MFTLFTVIFFVAKILGYISWSWWLVFSPILILVALFIIASIIMVIITWVTNRKATKALNNTREEFRKLWNDDSH